MLFTTRDVTIPPYDASSLVNSFQIQTYLEVILAIILIYDSRASSVSILCFLHSLTFYQSVHLTKRYVNWSLQRDPVVTEHNRQVKYFWVGGPVDINIEI